MASQDSHDFQFFEGLDEHGSNGGAKRNSVGGWSSDSSSVDLREVPRKDLEDFGEVLQEHLAEAEKFRLQQIEDIIRCGVIVCGKELTLQEWREPMRLAASRRGVTLANFGRELSLVMGAALASYRSALIFWHFDGEQPFEYRPKVGGKSQ